MLRGINSISHPPTEGERQLLSPQLQEDDSFISRCFSTKNMSPILVKSLSFGLIGVAFGAQVSGLGKVLASYGRDGEAASSIATSLSVFMIGTGVGFMSGTGVSIANVAKTNLQKIGMVIRVSWCWGVILGVAFAVVLEIAQRTFLSLFEHNEATKSITGEFFAGFAPSIIPGFLLLANGMVAFQVADTAIMPPVTIGLYRLLSLAVVGPLKDQLGPLGVGAVCSGAAWVSLAVSTVWLKHLLGPEFKLAQLDDKQEFLTMFRKFGKDGLQLGLQRITEWGNIAAISMSVGHFWAESGLRQIQPSIETITLINSFSQGYGLAAMMVIKKNHEQTKLIVSRVTDDIATPVHQTESEDLSPIQELANSTHENSRIFLRYIGSGLAINLCFGVITFSLAKQCSAFFLNDDDYELTDGVRNLFLTNSLGLLPDSARIISAAILRGRGDTMTPTVVNLILMTGVGVPVGIVAAKFLGDDKILPVFIVRDIGLTSSVMFNCYRYYKNVYKKDNAELAKLQKPEV